MTFTAAATRSELQHHVRSVAALAPDQGRKAAIAFAASILKLPYGRVRSLFYGLVAAPPAHEADQIRAYVKQAETLIQARQAYEQQRRDFLAGSTAIMGRLSPPSLEDAPAAAPEVEAPATQHGGTR
jgi:hypothetical protein